MLLLPFAARRNIFIDKFQGFILPYMPLIYIYTSCNTSLFLVGILNINK